MASHRARPIHAPTSIPPPRIARIRPMYWPGRSEMAPAWSRVASRPATASAMPSTNQPSPDRSRGGRTARRRRPHLGAGRGAPRW